MEQLLTRLAGTDDTLNRRLLALEVELRNQMAAIATAQLDTATAWVFPFVSLAAALAVLGMWGCRQFFLVRKLHAY